MKKLILLLTLFCFPAMALSQAEVPIIAYPGALPGTCQPFTIGFTRFGGAMAGLYRCTSANVFAPIGTTGPFRQQYIVQGTLTADSPYISHTATWNNAVVAFNGIQSDVTNTASAANSRLIDLRVGGANRFYVEAAGATFSEGGFLAGGGVSNSWNGRVRLNSPADGIFGARTWAGAALTRLIFGGATTADYGGIEPITVGAQFNGFRFVQADGTTVVFAELGAAANGTMVYCSDCTKATPCAAAGPGALAVRLAGAWDCNP